MDDSILLYDKDMARNPGRGSDWVWVCVGGISNEIFFGHTHFQRLLSSLRNGREVSR